jgi:hypothetical protein
LTIGEQNGAKKIAGDTLHDHLGLTREFPQPSGIGTMDFEHHTWFNNEVIVGSQICIYAQILARSTKDDPLPDAHGHESTGKVTAQFECINALVHMQARKTTLYPAEILTRIDAMLAEQSQPARPSGGRGRSHIAASTG